MEPFTEVTHGEIMREVSRLSQGLAVMEGKLEAFKAEYEERKAKLDRVYDWSNQMRGGMIVTTSGVGLLVVKELLQLVLGK